MAGNVYTWSTTAATNASADADINFAEGQTPGSVNDSARGLMAGVAGYVKDNNATLTTAGGTTAYTVTSNIAIAALATGLRLRLKFNATNTAASTLNVTPAGGAAFGAKAIRVQASSGGTDTDVAAGNLQNNGIYEFTYDAAANAAAGAWILMNPSFAGQLPFPATQNASSDANTLDDYEEGTFTPGFAFGGGTTGITYTTQQGIYTKIGRLVQFTLRVTLSAKGSSTGAWTVTGLPFTSAATFLNVAPVHLIADSNLLTGIYGVITASSTTISMFKAGTGGAAALADTDADATTSVVISGSYSV